MNSKNKKTLEKIFSGKSGVNLNWKDVENLFQALNAETSEGKGSRVRIYLNGVRAVFHRPHPSPKLHKGHINSIKKFLKNAQITYSKNAI